ncbi:MAG TPA: DUF92 domain-containing protein [Acidobacteriaceae bacterium]|nr:DUF92 domain-containing protein [Acidobacteriaceae bacterium]
MEPTETLPTAAPPPRPAIAPARERLQSELLVGGWLVLVLPLALLLLWVRAVLAWETGTIFTSVQMQGVYLSILLAVMVMALRAATPAAAAVGGVICFTTTLVTLLSYNRLSETVLPSLLTLFVLTFAATRLGRARKAALGLAEAKRGRAASQIVANLGVASAVALLHGLSSAAAPACVALLAEATADTVSSELGPLFRGRTLLLTTLQPVAPGTDGGVSLGGTLCGITAAAIVAAVGVVTLHLGLLGAAIAFPAAIAGLFADSLLGATLERRGWIGNDWVNFLSTAVTAVVALPLGTRLLP